VEHLASDVWPEFLEFVGETIPKDQKTKCGSISSRRAIFRGMVDVGYRGGYGIPERLGNVDAIMSGICASNEQAVDAVIGPVREAAFPHLVVTRIFMQ